MTNSLACVVIPIHSSTPTQNQLLSLQQCYRILKTHPIKVIAPIGLNVEAYRQAVEKIDVTFIDAKWQSSFFCYNSLKMSRFFYDLFKNYQYLLTYELDAWVFKDELNYWCNKRFDYIGAPWFQGMERGNSDKIIGVGNSGFSLRSVPRSMSILKRIEFLKKMRNSRIVNNRINTHLFYKAVHFFRKLFCLNSTKDLGNLFYNYSYNEDIFWSVHVAKLFYDYKVAPVEDACKFSFELNPSFLFRKNSDQLPFGCHGWEKHDPEFWKPYISISNFEESNSKI